MKYFVEIDGNASGPHDIVELLHLSKDGVITKASLSKPDDDSTAWKPIGEFLPSIMKVAETTEEVCVRDIDMKFGSMVTFMVKWALASIPAIIILSIIGFFIYLFGSIILAGLMGH
jgi:hypothetical protein